MLCKALAAAAALLAPTCALAGDLTPRAAGEVIDQIDKGFDSYMDPALAKRAQAVLRARRADYARIEDRKAFAEALTRDLYEATHDGHVKVGVETLDARANARLTDEQQALVDRRIAYGFMAARRLPANIGYLKLRYFEQGEEGARVITEALDLLKDTDALIIDLRENTGGGGAADETLLGHLSRAPIPMVSIRWRDPAGGEEVTRRMPRTPAGGPIYADKPVFLLTARRTFSAAEEFTYDLKAAGRATVVGEPTGGGANPSNRPVRLGYGFRVFIPNGKVTHPTTGTNWEGVGVSPDVATPADEALTEAYRRALAAARPLVSTVRSEQERAEAVADPRAVLLADQKL